MLIEELTWGMMPVLMWNMRPQYQELQPNVYVDHFIMKLIRFFQLNQLSEFQELLTKCSIKTSRNCYYVEEKLEKLIDDILKH